MGGGVALLLVLLLLPTLAGRDHGGAQVAAGGDTSTTAAQPDSGTSDEIAAAAETTTTSEPATTSTTRRPVTTTTMPLRGEHLAFAARVPGQENDIWAINADGTGLRQLTRTPGREYTPLWSPDGRSIAYFVDNNTASSTLHVMRSDGSNDRSFGDAPGNFGTWAPDSRHFVWTGPDRHLVVVDVQTGERRQISSGPDDEGAGAWSPRGDLIAYLCGLNLCVIRPDGTGRTDMGLANVYTPLAWAPDGSRIAFGRRTGDDTHPELGLYTIAADGTDLRRLTDYFGGATTWSPDGKVITYLELEDGLTVINPDGTGRRRLDPRNPCGQDPSWAPSSRFVALMCDPDTNHPAIYIVNADGSGRRRITDERFQSVENPMFSAVTAPA
jgi:TolB protein